MSVIIPSLCLGGYRSFGATQHVPVLSKLNVFIGANNAGKSNVLQFVHRMYPQFQNRHNALELERYDRRIGKHAGFRYGYAIDLRMDGNQHSVFRRSFAHLLKSDYSYSEQALSDLLMMLQTKAADDETPDFAWFHFDEQHKLLTEEWRPAFASLGPKAGALGRLARLIGQSSVTANLFELLMERIRIVFPTTKSLLIPAIRYVPSGPNAEAPPEGMFDGRGLPARLDALKNPEADEDHVRAKFDQIERFVRTVTSNPTAKLEIPSTKQIVNVRIEGKPLPLANLGTGVQEVVILATACTLASDTVVCLEEPELHLNPILLRRLTSYLLTETSNQYLISTHAAALMDTDEAEVYHVALVDGESRITHAKSGSQRSDVCTDLGYHPSDLLQCNCIIWVEGPSDRLYLKFWLSKQDEKLKEGIHYSIMFYGGHLRSHLTVDDIDAADRTSVEDFISLRRLNRRVVMVMDSDKDNETTELNATKNRLIEGFRENGALMWVTKGREIENYFRTELIQAAIDHVHGPGLKRKAGPFAALPKRNTGKSSVDKVAVAKYVVAQGESDAAVLDLEERLAELIEFIRASNPTVHESSQ